MTPTKDNASGAPEMTGHHVPSDLGEEARQTSVAGPAEVVPSRELILAIIRAWDDSVGSLPDLTYEDIERRLREAS